LSPYCSSVYEDAPKNYLIDYALSGNTGTSTARILGLSAAGNKVFDYSYPTFSCITAYRSIPVHWENLVFRTTPRASGESDESEAGIE
ncbi:MAG: hypothetical protein ABR589_08965, partial [Chthoniobacterales bacterium]